MLARKLSCDEGGSHQIKIAFLDAAIIHGPVDLGVKGNANRMKRFSVSVTLASSRSMFWGRSQVRENAPSMKSWQADPFDGQGPPGNRRFIKLHSVAARPTILSCYMPVWGCGTANQQSPCTSSREIDLIQKSSCDVPASACLWRPDKCTFLWSLLERYINGRRGDETAMTMCIYDHQEDATAEQQTTVEGVGLTRWFRANWPSRADYWVNIRSSVLRIANRTSVALCHQ